MWRALKCQVSLRHGIKRWYRFLANPRVDVQAVAKALISFIDASAIRRRPHTIAYRVEGVTIVDKVNCSC